MARVSLSRGRFSEKLVSIEVARKSKARLIESLIWLWQQTAINCG
jgi:hypothetical protein